MKSSGFSQAYGFSPRLFDSRIRAYRALFHALISYTYEEMEKNMHLFQHSLLVSSTDWRGSAVFYREADQQSWLP